MKCFVLTFFMILSFSWAALSMQEQVSTLCTDLSGELKEIKVNGDLKYYTERGEYVERRFREGGYYLVITGPSPKFPDNPGICAANLIDETGKKTQAISVIADESTRVAIGDPTLSMAVSNLSWMNRQRPYDEPLTSPAACPAVSSSLPFIPAIGFAPVDQEEDGEAGSGSDQGDYNDSGYRSSGDQYEDEYDEENYDTNYDDIMSDADSGQEGGTSGSGSPTDPQSNVSDGSCVPFNASYYKGSNSGQTIAAEMEKVSQQGTEARKQKFFEIFSPLALHIQSKTGWPASIFLSQIALESDWGKSRVFKNTNNFVGHSCMTQNSNSTRPIRNRQLQQSAIQNEVPGLVGRSTSDGNIRLRTPCSYKRPSNEGAYYRSFSSVLDATYLYADNILESNFYKSSSNYVKESFSNGRKPDHNRVIDGLGQYAVDPQYRSKLKSMIRANDLTKFDNMKSCN